ncbi:MAG: hypothetical protein PVH02_18960 [Desulfobacteraceae bacterium]|jgi:hypothetical protein
MIHNAYTLKKSSILMAAVCSLLLCTNVFADDPLNGQFQKNSYTFDFGPALSVSNEGLDVSLGFTYEDRDDLDELIPSSSLAYQMDPSGLMGLHESSRPSGTSRLFKWALNEYRFLKGVRNVVDEAEEKIEHYGKRMKVKGEVVFFQENSARLAGGENSNVGVGLNVREKGTFKSWLFSHKFVPRTFKWRFTADPGDETIGGRFFIGEYLTLEGNAGLNDNTNVFLLFRYTF